MIANVFIREKSFGVFVDSLVLFAITFTISGPEPYGETLVWKEDKSIMQIILSKEKAAMKRWRKGDPWGWTEISSREVSYIDPGITKHIDGLDEYKKYLQQFEGKINYQGSEFINPKVVTHGKMAVLTYNYKSTQEDKDGSIIDQTLWNTTEVYCFFNGDWKIIHTHWSYVKQKLPEQIEVPVLVETPQTSYNDVAGEIMALETAAMERWRKGDPWGFTDISSPDVTYFDTGTTSRLDGKAALKAEYSKIEGKIHYDIMDFISPKIQVHRDAAVLSYRFFDTQVNPDGTIASRTPWNCTEVYFKIDGKWMIVHTHWSYIKGEKT